MSKTKNPIRPTGNARDPQGAMSNVVYRPGLKKLPVKGPASRKK
jgi:hypothetical protein